MHQLALDLSNNEERKVGEPAAVTNAGFFNFIRTVTCTRIHTHTRTHAHI
jgi:hypothetical protein